MNFALAGADRTTGGELIGPRGAPRMPAPRRARGSRPAVWLVLCVLACATADGAAAQPRESSRKLRPAAPVLLVNADEDVGGLLSRARRLAKQGDHRGAIEILHALTVRFDDCFVSVGRRRHVGLGAAANDLIAQMGAEGLKVYRAAYDGRARTLYEKAVRTAQPELLRQVAYRYRHSSYGARAIYVWAAIDFDQGRFAQAARRWRQVLPQPPQGVSKPLVLLRIASACHLAGQGAEARAAAATLKQRFGDATGLLAGREQNLAAAAQRVLKIPVAAAAGQRKTSKDWPGLGGVANGLAVMDECDLVVARRWRRPAEKPSDKASRAVKLIAKSPLRALCAGSDTGRASPRTRNGHVLVKRYRWSEYMGTAVLPPMVHPVVADGAVIYRTDDEVVACDLLTGKRLWGTDKRLPLEKTAPADSSSMRFYFGSEPVRKVGDSGRYLLTVGAGKVFARFGFPALLPTYVSGAVRHLLEPGKELDDSSALAAIRLGPAHDGGRLAWRIGHGRGDDDVIRQGRFVSAPTYYAGRLYVLVLHVETYHVVCLDADSGRTLWNRAICQAPPAPSGGWWRRRSSGWLFDRCSPPAVADGRVFALPNVGVVAALASETGRVVWAYHYKSRLNVRAGGSASASSQAGNPVNPVLAFSGRVICLPADSDFLVALSPEEGKPVWPGDVKRNGQADLSAIGEDRLLLSGPGLMVLSAADGKRLDRLTGIKGIVGRPAVTPTKVLASGQGKIIQLDLETYEPTSAELAGPRDILGNLVSVQDTLVAANASGVCAYFGYDLARAKLNERIKACPPPERARLLLRRARLAFNAKAFDESLADLGQCKELCERFGDAGLMRLLPSWTHRIYIALGNQAEKPQDMRAKFQKALSFAATRQERAHTKLRLAKCHEKLGEFSAAMALAQQLSEEFARDDLVDVPIGRNLQTDDLSDQRGPRPSGKKLGQAFIRRLISLHGRGPYAAFDAKAAAALKKARAAGDPEAMVAVYDRWPNSVWGDDARFAAAEVYYAQARAEKGEKADELFARAIEHLSEAAAMSDSPLRLSAAVGLAAIYARAGNRAATALLLDRIPEEREDTPVRFADVQGGLGEVVRALRAGRLPATPKKGR